MVQNGLIIVCGSASALMYLYYIHETYWSRPTIWRPVSIHCGLPIPACLLEQKLIPSGSSGNIAWELLWPRRTHESLAAYRAFGLVLSRHLLYGSHCYVRPFRRSQTRSRESNRGTGIELPSGPL